MLVPYIEVVNYLMYMVAFTFVAMVRVDFPKLGETLSNATPRKFLLECICMKL